MALPGETPRFPLIVVAPVFVTVVPARTPNAPAVPSPTVAGLAANAVGPAASIPIATATARPAVIGRLAPRIRGFIFIASR
jgi:hypothetical protein